MGKVKTQKKLLNGLRIVSGKYLIDKVYKGQRIYKRLGFVDEMTILDAMAILEDELHKIDLGKTCDEVTEERSLTITVREALNYLWEKRLKFKSYANDIKPNLSALSSRIGNRTVASLVRSDFEQYIRERSLDKKRNGSKGCISPRTVQKELQNLSMAINLLVSDGILEINKIRDFIKVPQIRPSKTVLDDGFENGPQWQALYEAMSDSIKPILLCLYETGMRPKECFNMRKHWLIQKNEECWVIKVPAIDTVDGEIVFKEKTKNEHLIPVSPTLLSILKKQGIDNSTDLFFPAPRKKGPRSDIDTAFSNAVKKAGLVGKGITPYTLRRTRLTIFDAVDSAAGMHAGGHVAKDIHYRHYVNISLERLFRLVGLEYSIIGSGRVA